MSKLRAFQLIALGYLIDYKSAKSPFEKHRIKQEVLYYEYMIKKELGVVL